MIKNIANFEIEVIKKKNKNMYLSVLPGGKIRVTAPKTVTYKEIERFVILKSDWIKEKQEKIIENTVYHEYKSGEILYLFGEKLTLSVIKGDNNYIICKNGIIFLTVKSDNTDRLAVINEWYRQQLKEKISDIFPECEKKTTLYASSWNIRDMKTRWGSCNTYTKKIWLNLQLAKMPVECLEYVIFHELAHLAVPNHGCEFKKLLDQFMPDWRNVKKYLNKEYPRMQ